MLRRELYQNVPFSGVNLFRDVVIISRDIKCSARVNRIRTYRDKTGHRAKVIQRNRLPPPPYNEIFEYILCYKSSVSVAYIYIYMYTFSCVLFGTFNNILRVFKREISYDFRTI